MPAFGNASNRNLDTCINLLQVLFRRVILERDCSVIFGRRGKAKQNALYAKGRDACGNVIDRRKVVTNAKWGESSHNSTPSKAADVIGYPEGYEGKGAEEAFEEIFTIVQRIWKQMAAEGLTKGYKLVWGGDWDGDGDRTDQTLGDSAHWEVVKING